MIIFIMNLIKNFNNACFFSLKFNIFIYFTCCLSYRYWKLKVESIQSIQPKWSLTSIIHITIEKKEKNGIINIELFLKKYIGYMKKL